jgi:predicted NBD/HSP70 family sugar kinase
LLTDDSYPVVVYDVGGSHISASTWSPSQLNLPECARATLAEGISTSEFMDALTDVAQRVLGGCKHIKGVAMAVPGPFDHESGISHMQHKLEHLYGFNLRGAIAERLKCAVESVAFLNDAHAFLLGELSNGAARGALRAVGVTLGTGIGSAFAVHGRIVTAGRGVAEGGEIWNVPYSNGTVEDVLSTRALQASYESRAGKKLSVAELAINAQRDEVARAVFADFGLQLGRVLCELLANFAPDVIVIGGGISRAADLFFPGAASLTQRLGMQLLISSLSDRAPLIGAAMHWNAKSGHGVIGQETGVHLG